MTSTVGPTRLRGLWAKARTEKTWSYVVAAGALAVLVLGDEIGRHIDSFESWIESLGPLALVVFALLYAVLSSIFVPDTLLGIIAGASFGFPPGLAAVVAGSLGGAVLQYVLSRRLLKPAIDRILVSKPALAAIQTAVRRQELRLQLLIRLTPLNRAMTSYMLGAGGVGFLRFVGALVAVLPSLAVEVYFGYAGKHLARMSQPEHTVVLHDGVLLAGLVVAIAVMVSVARLARQAVDAAAVGSSPLDMRAINARESR